MCLKKIFTYLSNLKNDLQVLQGKDLQVSSSSSSTRMRINGGKVDEFELRNSNSVTRKRISETKEEEPTVLIHKAQNFAFGAKSPES